MTGPMGWPLPDPARLDPPPGDPVALADLATRLDAAAAFLGDLCGRLGVAPAAACGWAGADAAAADAQVARVGDLARSAADALVCAAARVRRHEEVLTDVRQRLAQLRRAQAEDYGTAVARMGAAALRHRSARPRGGGGRGGPGRRGGRPRRVRAAMLGEVEVDAAATAAVLAGCGAVAGGGDGAGASGPSRTCCPAGTRPPSGSTARTSRTRFLRPGADLQSTEEAARRLLPWAGNGAVAAEVLTGLGADGVQEALRLLGDGSLSAGSALAGVMAAVLGAPVPTGAAAEVARARDVRHVDPDDVRTLDADHVALGMGVVLAAARRSGRPGPPPATVREWGRQVIAREQALGEPVRERLRPSPALPGDPLEEVLGRLARADAGPQAAGLLRAEPTWTTLLARPWDDGGAAFAAAVERATAEPGHGDVVVRSGLRALGVGLADDGDPAGWTVDRATAASVAPALADAVAARPEVVAEPLARAAAGAGEQDRPVLRGLGIPDRRAGRRGRARPRPGRSRPERGNGGAGRLPGGPRVRAAPGPRPGRVRGPGGGRPARRRDDHAGHGRAVVPPSGRRAGRPTRDGAVRRVGADGTWDASPDEGLHVRVPCGDPEAAAYGNVAAVLGAPTAPMSPPTDWVGVAAAVVPGGERLRDVVEAGVGAAEDARELVDADAD